MTSMAAGASLLIGWLLDLTEVPGTIILVSHLTAIPIGGYYFGPEAVEELLTERRVGIELLMGTAAVVAALTGQIAEGTSLVSL